MMDNLPKGWTKEKLPQVAEVIMGQSPPSSTYNTGGDGLPFFQGKAEFGKLYPSVIKYCNSPKKIAEAGDVLISIRAPVGPTNLCKEKSCIGRRRSAFRPNQVTTTKYLFYYMRNIESWLSTQGTGSTFTAISKTDLENIEILVPPLNEQRRIVAKLEKLLQKVDACKERLDKIPTILKRFRQSILAAVCTGRLTADWREEGQNVLSAKDISERIQKKRLDSANTPAQKKKIKEFYSCQEKEDSDLLPESWRYITLDKLCESFQYGTSKKSMKSGKIPVLRMGNLQNGEIDWSDLAYTSDDNEIEKYKLNIGDVLFNRTNSPELVGKTSIYRGKHPAIFAGYLIKINNFEELDSEYLNYCLNSAYAKEFFLRVKTDGVSQSNINAKKLGKFEVPFCSSEEQKEIVHRVKVLFKIADQIEKRYNKARAYVDKLTQSILAKAFRGELVPQEPNDEPASELLKRIKEERPKLNIKPKAKSKGK